MERSNTKSVEYRLHIRIGKRQEAKGGIDNKSLITGFSINNQSLITRFSMITDY